MTAMTCSRATPAFTVRMTSTPVVAAGVTVWAADELLMEVPVRVRVSATAALRIAFIGLIAPITAGSLVLCACPGGSAFGLDIGVGPDLQVRCKTACRVGLLAIILSGHEAELHSQAGCPRRG